MACGFIQSPRKNTMSLIVGKSCFWSLLQIALKGWSGGSSLQTNAKNAYILFKESQNFECRRYSKL